VGLVGEVVAADRRWLVALVALAQRVRAAVAAVFHAAPRPLRLVVLVALAVTVA